MAPEAEDKTVSPQVTDVTNSNHLLSRRTQKKASTLGAQVRDDFNKFVNSMLEDIRFLQKKVPKEYVLQKKYNKKMWTC